MTADQRRVARNQIPDGGQVAGEAGLNEVPEVDPPASRPEQGLIALQFLRLSHAVNLYSIEK